MRWAGRIMGAATAAAGLLGALGTSAHADDWLPHPAGAQWQYQWVDSAYNPQGTFENVVVQKSSGQKFTLAWADTAEKPPASGQAISCTSSSDIGTVDFLETNAGMFNTNWGGCPPPQNEPILCASASNCANSLSSALYNVIWGVRSPVLSEPLLQGISWNSTGGASNDVTSSSTYLGMTLIKVPAFPGGVEAAGVRTRITQAGALGDPYGSGIRTTWWVYGVGPVRIVFQHSGGSDAPVTNVYLRSTNLKPLPSRPDVDLFPLRLNLSGTYTWTNSRYMKKAEVERLTVSQVASRSALVQAKSVSGPIRAAGAYVFTTRLDGVTNISGASSAATLLKWPKLAHGRHFFTPVDLMVFGFNPLLPAYPAPGSTWHSGNPTDFTTFGVTGASKVTGTERVRVPAGTFTAYVVRSTLNQPGHRFGSGVRTMWFVPGRGLVKLVFAHRDGSVDTVALTR